MNIVVIGTGYVGLVTGTCFAEMGNKVTCVDINTKIIENLKNGIIPIYEENLEDLVKSNIKADRLHFTVNMAESVSKTDIIFIAVGTPEKEDGSANTDYVFKAAEDIGNHLQGHTCIVIKSTVPVGTSEKIGEIIGRKIGNSTTTFDIVSNPEFLKEGVAISDFMKPDRIIIGTNSSRSEQIMKDLYAPFNRNHNKIISMSIRDSELTKYVSNCMLATKISFINEMSVIAEAVGANIENIRLGIGADKRIGYDFIYPGCGYGGSCFPKDVSALINICKENNIDPVVLKSVDQRNNLQKTVLFKKFNAHYESSLVGKTVTLWGISFKPGTDDIREASSLVLIDELIKNDIQINVTDPIAIDNLKKYITQNYPDYDKVNYFDDQYEALNNSSCLFIVTEWKSYRQPDFDLIHTSMLNPVIVDGRNIYIHEKDITDKFAYYCIGK